MLFCYPYNVLSYNAANGVSPFFSIYHSQTPKGVSAASSRSYSKDSTLTTTAPSRNLIFNDIIVRLSAVQKNLSSAKRQLKVLSSYTPEEIREDSALRLKASQLELTLKHIFDESTAAFSKEELNQILTILETVK
jgi:hypothetical protein